MKSAAIIVLLALFSAGPSAAERLFSTPLRDAAVNHDLAKVKKTQENISNRAEADSASVSEHQDSRSPRTRPGPIAR